MFQIKEIFFSIFKKIYWKNPFAIIKTTENIFSKIIKITQKYFACRSNDIYIAHFLLVSISILTTCFFVISRWSEANGGNKKAVSSRKTVDRVSVWNTSANQIFSHLHLIKHQTKLFFRAHTSENIFDSGKWSSISIKFYFIFRLPALFLSLCNTRLCTDETNRQRDTILIFAFSRIVLMACLVSNMQHVDEISMRNEKFSYLLVML